MKKNIILILLLTLVLMLAGCTKKEDTEKDITGSVTENSLENTTANDSNDEIEVSDEDVPLLQEEVAYDVTIKEYMKTDNIDIDYPEITGWENADMQAKWNDFFVENARSMSEGYGENDSTSYNVKIIDKTSNMLSIVMDGYMYFEGSAHPSSFISTCNIDMQTGDELMLKDFANPEDIADILLNTSDYTVLTEGVTLDNILEYNFMGEKPTKDLLTTSFTHFDGEYEIYGDGECFGSSYMENGKIHLVFEVPHALGDFVIVRIEDNLSQNLIDISLSR